MGTLWPRSSSLEWDDNGALAEGALAHFYQAGTSTPLTVYQDGDETTAHEDPVEADGARWPAVFVPYGSYKFIIKTAAGTTLFSADDVPNEAPNDTEVTVDANSIFQTGDIILAGKNGDRPGFIRCNGKTIGNAASAATQRANDDTEDLFAYLWDNYADARAAVSGGRGATAAADFAANKSIAVPDYRGYVLGGFSDMGGASDNGTYINAPVVSGSGILAGSRVGEYTHTLITAELASHTHAFSATTGDQSVDHAHNVTGTSSGASVGHTHTGTTDSGGAHTHTVSGGTQGGTANFPTGIGGGAQSLVANTTAITIDSGGAHTHTFTTGGVSADHTHSFNVTSGGTNTGHTHSVSGTSGSNGSGTAHNIIQPTAPVTILMKL